MSRRRRSVTIIALVAIAAMMPLALLSVWSQRASAIGLVEGRLADCPKTNNCVCTQDKDARRRLDPIKITCSSREAIRRLESVVGEMPGAEVRTRQENYLHVEFTSKFFRFVDDAEFLIDEAAGLIHFRSASRVGRSDFGVNRRRMEIVREKFAAL